MIERESLGTLRPAQSMESDRPPTLADREASPPVSVLDGEDRWLRTHATHAWAQHSLAFALTRFNALVDDKAWEHLGLTGPEFRLLWAAGAFRGCADPSVQAMEPLMRAGVWRGHQPLG